MKLLTLALWSVLLVSNISRAEDLLLAFTADWCVPCQQFKADYMADAGLVGGHVTEIIDVDSAKEMTKDFDVKSVPTFIVVKVGADNVVKKANVVKRQVGYEGPRKFKKWLER